MSVTYTKRSYPYFLYKIGELVRVKATQQLVTIQDRDLCEGKPCYLANNTEYWQEELADIYYPQTG